VKIWTRDNSRKGKGGSWARKRNEKERKGDFSLLLVQRSSKRGEIPLVLEKSEIKISVGKKSFHKGREAREKETQARIKFS